MTNDIYTLALNCTGPNRECRKAHRAGRVVHVIPPRFSADRPTLVMPTYHYTTEAEGVEAITTALATAPTVATDADLYAYRKAGVAHYLPVGWIDPTLR